MPYKIELTWHEARSCWKRMYCGKTYYLGKGQCRGRSDMEGYKAAWAEWEQRKRSADLQSSRQEQVVSASPTAPLASLAFATDYKAVDYEPKAVGFGPMAETRISQLITIFIAQKQSQADTAAISPKMYGQYRSKLNDFERFTKNKGKVHVGEISPPLLSDYREMQLHLITREDDHKISPHTAKKRLMAVKQLLTWLYEQEVIEKIPRNLNRQFTHIKMHKPSPSFFTVEEVRTMFNAASQRTQLYIALGLNCGYTQKDIATLEHGMVNLDTGEVRRDRHKTQVSQVHRLWPSTLELLRREKTAGDSGLMLLDEKGQELVREKINDSGQLTLNDTIRLAFDRVMAKIGMGADKRRFSIMRKTSSNEIERAFPEYPHLSSQFLAHGEKATKRHYVAHHYELLFRAIEHLDRHFGFTPIAADTPGA